jgi:hypothetical protein
MNYFQLHKLDDLYATNNKAEALSSLAGIITRTSHYPEAIRVARLIYDTRLIYFCAAEMQD